MKHAERTCSKRFRFNAFALGLLAATTLFGHSPAWACYPGEDRIPMGGGKYACAGKLPDDSAWKLKLITTVMDCDWVKDGFVKLLEAGVVKRGYDEGRPPVNPNQAPPSWGAFTREGTHPQIVDFQRDGTIDPNFSFVVISYSELDSLDKLFNLAGVTKSVLTLNLSALAAHAQTILYFSSVINHEMAHMLYEPSGEALNFADWLRGRIWSPYKTYNDEKMRFNVSCISKIKLAATEAVAGYFEWAEFRRQGCGTSVGRGPQAYVEFSGDMPEGSAVSMDAAVRDKVFTKWLLDGGIKAHCTGSTGLEKNFGYGCAPSLCKQMKWEYMHLPGTRCGSKYHGIDLDQVKPPPPNSPYPC